MQRRRFKQTLSFHDRLNAWADEVRRQAAALEPGPERDALLMRARQADVASQSAASFLVSETHERDANG
jgi:hypothetical protein